MVNKKETELDQEALDKLMQGVSSGIEAWSEEDNQTAAETKYPPLQPETYNKEEIAKLMDEYNTYIVGYDTYAEKTPESERKSKEQFNEEFEQTVIGGTKDVEDFASGLLSAEPDALDDMEKYIELFGKEYINGSYQLTPAAQKAMERIKELRQKASQEAEKKHVAETIFKETREEIKQKEEENNKTTKIKELMKKKPQERTLQDYLFLKEAIEQNPHRTPEQKAKDVERLTSQARLRMKEPKKIKAEELAVVPAFIAAFGYDKGNAINKEALRFKDAMDKRMTAEKTTDNDFVISVAEEEKQPIQKTKGKEKNKDEKKQKKGLIGWFKDKAAKLKKGLKRFAPIIAVGLLASPMLTSGHKGEANQDNDNGAKTEKTILTPNREDEKTIEGGSIQEVVITGVDRSKVDANMLKQYARRIGHQEKLSAEAAVERAIDDLRALKNLPDETKAKLAGKTDEEKLAKLGVVRGDQNKLHAPIDSLLSGEKINPLTLKDISERTFCVTDDFGAHKDNNLKNGKQTIDMSTYLIQKSLNGNGNSK